MVRFTVRHAIYYPSVSLTSPVVVGLNLTSSPITIFLLFCSDHTLLTIGSLRVLTHNNRVQIDHYCGGRSVVSTKQILTWRDSGVWGIVVDYTYSLWVRCLSWERGIYMAIWGREWWCAFCMCAHLFRKIQNGMIVCVQPTIICK